ncbi:MAG: type II toxin-antitoxin system Phd/YefM family antitoxin [Acidobacteriota bacterium]|nr:type II toxin-antitoxin system Phd/YefM family antitoxin [Acidobacteriota bacterium]
MAQVLAKKRARTAVGRVPIAMAEARKQLPKLADALEKHPEIGAVKITRHGKPVLAVLSWDLYEAVVETMEIMSDPETMAAFRQGVKEMEAGKAIPLAQFKREHGF